MFILGHTSLAATMVRPLIGDHSNLVTTCKFAVQKKKYSALFLVMLGSLLPDLIDKILFYVPYSLGWDTGMISGTRTFAHTLLFCSMLFLFRKTRFLGLGVATHLTLDHVAPLIILFFTGNFSQIALEFSLSSIRMEGLLWPFLGTNFPPYIYDGIQGHMSGFLKRADLIAGEIIGLFIWVRHYWIQRT